MTGTPTNRPELFPYALMGIGGFCGSVLHFWINTVFFTLAGTLLVNTLGSVLMGIFMYELIATGRFGQRARFFIGVGFLGAFTTFSGLALIAVDLPPVLAVSYVAATLILGLLGIFTGRTIVGILHGVPDMDPWVLVGIGGAAGSILRYECSKLQPVRGLPAGTLAVNVLGSFMFGIVVFSRMPEDLLYLAGIGGMGGFTTFSTFSYETFWMLEDQDYYAMLANILTNGGGSILGVMVALWIRNALIIAG